MASCCTCGQSDAGGGGTAASLPLICLVPREGGLPGAKTGGGGGGGGARSSTTTSSNQGEFRLLDEDYIKKHFNLPPRAQYLDPFRRPLITFPMSQEEAKNFNMAKKNKINQQILDGFLDPSEAISAPSVFPYAASQSEKRKEDEEEEEIIYILQLPDWEFQCPTHGQKIRTPRFIWHSCKKSKKGKGAEQKQGGGPMNKPKPWLLSRHTDFDLLSQCPLAKPGFDALSMSSPILIQMNPEGKWENAKPESLDEERLRTVVQHLIKSQAVTAAQSYCCQCAANSQKESGKSNYVPVIMMPIYPADQCPFDMDCEIQKMKDSPETKTTKKSAKTEKKLDSEKEKEKTKKKKRGFVMQRLTDFDLLSQW